MTRRRRRPALRTRPMIPKRVSGPPEFLAAVLAGVPRLENPLCVKVPTVMDGDDDESIEQAMQVCSACKARPQCAAWAESLPVGALSGVVAGVLRRSEGGI